MLLLCSCCSLPSSLREQPEDSKPLQNGFMRSGKPGLGRGKPSQGSYALSRRAATLKRMPSHCSGVWRPEGPVRAPDILKRTFKGRTHGTYAIHFIHGTLRLDTCTFRRLGGRTGRREKNPILQPLNIGPLFTVTGYRPKTAREGASHVWDGGRGGS